MTRLSELRRALRRLADPAKAEGSQRFFKTGPGEYGEGDRFLGITVPQTRSLLRQSDGVSEADVLTLLHSEWHEERLLALLILIRRFEKAKRDDAAREHFVKLYLANTRKGSHAKGVVRILDSKQRECSSRAMPPAT